MDLTFTSQFFMYTWTVELCLLHLLINIVCVCALYEKVAVTLLIKKQV